MRQRFIILILILMVCSSWYFVILDVVDLTEYKIENNKWYCTNTFYDSLYNPSFRPNPLLLLNNYEMDEDIFDLNIKLSNLIIDTIKRKIQLQGAIGGGWYGGWGSEVLIMTATRIDTTTVYWILKNNHNREFIPIDTIDCMIFIDFDYCYTDYGLKDVKEYRKLDCTLNYTDSNDVLFIGLENCCANLFDLKKIIKKYGR